MDTPRFPSLFFRQRLNAAGIPMLVGVLLFLYLPKIALPLIFLLALGFLILAFVFKGEDRKIFLWLCFGLALALLLWGKTSLDQKKLSALMEEERCAVGYVVEDSAEGDVLALCSLDSKPFFRKIRLVGENSFACGEKREVTVRITQVFPKGDRAEGVDLEGRLVRSEKLLGKSYLYTMVGKVRAHLLSRFATLEEGPFLSAILLGERGEMEKSVTDAFRRTASSHILAVSGLHISLLVGFLLTFLRRLTAPMWLSRIVLFVSVPVLFLLAGAGISVFRASVMTLFAATGLCLKRRTDSVTSLVFSASLLVLLDPFAPESASFLLSYLATFAMVSCAVPFSDYLCDELKESFSVSHLTPLVKDLLSGFAVAVALFCFTFSVQLLLFDEIQPLAPLYAPVLILLFQPCLAAAALASLFPMGIAKILLLVPKGYLALLSALSRSAPDPIALGDASGPLALMISLVLLSFFALKCRVSKILYLYLGIALVLVGIYGISFLI